MSGSHAFFPAATNSANDVGIDAASKSICEAAIEAKNKFYDVELEKLNKYIHTATKELWKAKIQATTVESSTNSAVIRSFLRGELNMIIVNYCNKVLCLDSAHPLRKNISIKFTNLMQDPSDCNFRFSDIYHEISVALNEEATQQKMAFARNQYLELNKPAPAQVAPAYSPKPPSLASKL